VRFQNYSIFFNVPNKIIPLAKIERKILEITDLLLSLKSSYHVTLLKFCRDETLNIFLDLCPVLFLGFFSAASTFRAGQNG